MTATFSYFIHSRDKLQFKIHLDYFLLLQKIDDTVSELYFRNYHHHHIDVPTEIFVTNSTKQLSVPILSTNCFHLLHEDNYIVTVNNNYYFSFTKSQR